MQQNKSDLKCCSKIFLVINNNCGKISLQRRKQIAEVRINKKEDFEKALKKFKMQCKKEGIIKEYKERQYYTKPSQKRRRNVRKKK